MQPITIPPQAILWLGLIVGTLSLIIGVALVLKSASKQKAVQLGVLWGAWALLVVGFVFAQHLNALRDNGRTTEPLLLGAGVVITAVITAVLAGNGLTLAEMTLATILTLIVGGYGWYIHQGDAAALSLALTVLVELVIFGSKKIEVSIGNRDGRLAATAQPLRWVFVVGALIGIGFAIINLANGSFQLPDAKAARASIGGLAGTATTTTATGGNKPATGTPATATPAPTTTTQQSSGPRMATEAEENALNACYTFDAEKYTINVLSHGKPKEGSTNLPITDMWGKVRAYAHADMEVTFREGVTYRIPWCVGSKL